MSGRRKLSGGLAFAPLIWKQADMLVGVGTLVLEFGIPEALAATGLMIAFGPEIARAGKRAVGRMRGRRDVGGRTARPPMSKVNQPDLTLLEAEAISRVIKDAPRLLDHTHEVNFRTATGHALHRGLSVPARSAAADRITAMLLLDEFEEEIRDGRDSRGRYDEVLLTRWLAAREAIFPRAPKQSDNLLGGVGQQTEGERSDHPEHE